MFSPVRSKWRAAAVLLAVSVGAAACGSTETGAPTLNPQATSAEAAESASDSTDAAAPEAAETTDSEAAVSENDSGEEAAPAVNLFPAVDVLDISDGGTVNLATELGGGDKATLLWFFAPH